MLPDPLLCSTAAVELIARLQGEPRLEAPKAKLFWLVLRGLFDDSPVVVALVLVLGAVLLFGLPAFLAWDFAKGTRRRAWIWVGLAVVASWLVLPVLLFLSRRDAVESAVEGE